MKYFHSFEIFEDILQLVEVHRQATYNPSRPDFVRNSSALTMGHSISCAGRRLRQDDWTAH